MADKYYRLVCFVVDICADVLRKYFVKLAKTDVGNTYTSVDAYLSHRNRDVMQLFNNKKLRRDQYDLLYPGNGTADENQWDVSILVTLITELFAARLQPLVIVALKNEIRGIRNELQHHPNTGTISDDDFDDYWGRLDSSVRLIAMNALDTNDQASLLEKINQVKCNHLPNLGDCLRIWHEETSKQLLNTMNKMQANAEETTSILRQVVVQKPGPSGDKNKRIKVADDILARLQAGFESTLKELSGNFNPPSEVSDIRAKLRDCHHVLVTGCNNSRYFETALAAIKGMDYNYKRCVEMHTSSDWRHIDPEDVDFVLCRDPFGGFSYDESKAKAMGDIFKSMLHSTKKDNGDKALDIVIITDLNILEECKMHHDHEILDEVVKVFIETSSAQPADLTIGCRRQRQYAQSSSLPVTRNNLGALTECFLKAYKISSGQVDDEIFKKAKKSFQVNKAIVLTGRKKCDKTSIAVALASVYEENQCLLLKKPHDIDKIDFPNICLVIIDEFAGKYRYEENDVYEWYTMFDHLYNTVIAGQMNVIITCEKDKLEKCINEIGRHAILDHVVDVTLQKAVVKLEVTEQYGHVSGQIVTTDHYVGTISNTTQTLNYTSSFLADPSQGPIPLSRYDTIPVSTRSTSFLGLEYGHVSGQFVNIDHSSDTNSNTTQSKNYTPLLPVVPSQRPILMSSHDRFPLSTSLLGMAQIEGIQNPMQLKRGFSGMERVKQTETDDLSVKRSRLMSSGLWSVEEKREINIKTNTDYNVCDITGSCILPSGEILLTDNFNKKLKKLDNMYNVKCVCDLPHIAFDVCYVGDNIAVVSLMGKKLQFVDIERSMKLIRSIDIDHSCRGLACHGDQMYVSNINGSVYSYSTDGIKQQHIYSSRNNIPFHYNNYSITVSDDGSKLYLPCENELVTIDNNGNHLFTLNNEDIDSSCGVCVDDQSFVYVNDMNGNIIQISEDGKTILQARTNLSAMTGILPRTLTFDRKNKALIAAGRSDTIRVFKLRKQWETQTR